MEERRIRDHYLFFKEYDSDAVNDIMNMRMKAVEQGIKISR